MESSSGEAKGRGAAHESNAQSRKASPTRRRFLGTLGVSLAAAAAAGPPALAEDGPAAAKPKAGAKGPRIGLVTYLLAKDWDVKTIIKNCAETRFEGVELRTGHAHGVEISLGPSERKDVRARFEDSPVALASLGGTYEFHSTDPKEVRKNIDGAKEYAKLAADVGAKGIKVRPNGLQTGKGIPADATLRQIGESLAEVGEAAARLGVEVRVEVHGSETSRLPNMKVILDRAAHKNVFACWNSNGTDLLDGGLEANFALVKERIGFVHMRDLYLEDYPFRRLLGLLRDSGYEGYCCAEIPESGDPLRVMRYYRALFLAYQGVL